MKNLKILSAILTTALILTLTFASCGGGGGGGTPTPPPAGPTSARYESEGADGNTYVLEITKASGRAAYAPKNGDNYVLTITKDGVLIGTSNGTVTVSVKNKNSTFTLQPETPNGSEKPTPFTITIVTTDSGLQRMDEIKGPITLTNGETREAPKVNPIQEFLTFDLKAEKYSNVELWTNSLNLSDFTNYEPKKGDKLNFRISGTMDKPLEWFSVGISSHINKDPWYRWLGSREDGYIDELPATFNYTFVIEAIDDPLAPNSVKIGFSNILWQIGDDDSDWSHVSGFRVSDAEVGKVMATIRNFKIVLLMN